MTLVRDRIPFPEDYFLQQGWPLRGRGNWRTGPCVAHGGSDSMRVNLASGGWMCMACGIKGGDMLELHRQVNGLDFVSAARDLGAWEGQDGEPQVKPRAPIKPRIRPAETHQHETLSEYGRQLWSACTGLRGTLGEQYLLKRHCAIPPEDGGLRYFHALKHQSGYVGPALVALVTDAVTGRPISLHRTWIKSDGGKADVDPPRMVLGGHHKQGGVIRLWPDECVTYGLGIAEGIETALTLATVLQPVWSLIDAGNLAAFPALPGIEALTIAADNDPAGMMGATDCATRWTRAGCDVRLVVPPLEGTDLNDVARDGT